MTRAALITSSRRHRLAATVVVAAALIAACGSDPAPGDAAARTTTSSAPTTTTAVQTPRPTGDLDRIVQITHGGLHLRCVGAGHTTVLLIPGWSDGGERWSQVENALRNDARVCSYAPFGTGTSDPPPESHTFRSEADDLAELLDAAGEPGPYVVVGHSFGGARAVTFTDQHRHDVAGVLLLDASPATWADAVCAVRNDGSETAGLLAGLCAAMHDPELDPATNPERLRVAEAFDEVAAIPSLGDIPLSVVMAAERDYGDLGPDQAARLGGEFEAGNRRWAALSTRSEVSLVPDTGHYIQVDQPAVVVEAIRALMP